MGHLSSDVVKVADNQITYLARRSQELDQETRITVYTFNSRGTVKCLIYDKDVLRMPSIASLYSTRGLTALVDATLMAIRDLKMTPEKYGEHAFLIYVLTDGQENNSASSPLTLKTEISSLPDHWTVATFVPDQMGKFEAKKFGFHPDNIAVWNTDSAGIAEVGETIRRTSEQFMQNRKAGIRGSKSLFKLNTVSPSEIVSTLTPLSAIRYSIRSVGIDCRVDDFVTAVKGSYSQGEAYYELTKTETIQAKKKIAILYNGQLYGGSEARKLLGLPDQEVKVKPENYTSYKIFVQSGSVNRKLIGGTQVLIMP